MARRRRGGGSVRKREYTREGRSWTRWIASFDLPPGRDGKRRRENFTATTEGEAWEWVADQKALQRANTPAAPGVAKATVGDLLVGWLQHGRTIRDWSPGHASRSQGIVDRDLAPLHDIPARDLHVDDIDALFAARRRAGVSRDTLRLMRAALSAALELAIRRRVLPPDRNLARLVELPKARRRDPQFLDSDQVTTLLEKVEGDRLRPLFVTTMALGLRPSEAFGLLWEHVDLDASTVQVGRTTQYVDGAYHHGEGKTAESAAELALPDFLVELLRDHRQDLRLQRMANRRRWRERAIVFPNTTGGDLHGPWVNRKLSDILEAAELPHITFRELRHTGATLMLSLGVPLERVQTMLRHTDAATTRRYAQVTEPLRRDDAAAMDRFLRGGA